MSSSVVVVNITRSRRRTTDKPTEEGLLGWSVLQDVTGRGPGDGHHRRLGTRRPVTPGRARAARRLRGARRRRGPGAAVRPAAAALRARPVPDRLGRVGARPRRPRAPCSSASRPPSPRSSPASRSATGPETAEARRRLLPFRDVFAVLFFVAVGTLIDPGTVPAAVPQIACWWRWSSSRRSCSRGSSPASPGSRPRPVQLAVGLGPDGRVRLRARGDRPDCRRRLRRAVHRGPGLDRDHDRGLGGPGPVRRQGAAAGGAPRRRGPPLGRPPSR